MRLKLFHHRENQKGSALMAVVILSFVLISAILWYSNWVWNRSRADVPELTAQRAMQYADSCVSSTSPWLKNPNLKQILAPGTSNSFVIPMTNGHCDVSLQRDATTMDYIDTFATGYYYVASGNTVDPTTTTIQHCSMAVINAKYIISNVAEYLSAVPGTLEIGYGADASTGTLYGGNLLFDSGTGNPKTQIGSAYYTASSSPTDLSGIVTFYGVQNTVKLNYVPSFASLDSNMLGEYSAAAGTATPASVFSGGVVSAPTSHVYYVTGNVDIGKTAPLVADGVYVICATGSVYIHNNITLNPNSWVAVLAAGDIHISTDAPAALTIYGNYVTNGFFGADALVPAPGSKFQLFGGIVSLSNISVSSGYATRTYKYQSCSDSNLMLPNISRVEQYTVTAGGAAAH